MDEDDFRGKFPVISPTSYEEPVSASLLLSAAAKSAAAGLAVGLGCLVVAFSAHSPLFTVLLFARAVMIGSVLSFGIFLAQAREL